MRWTWFRIAAFALGVVVVSGCKAKNVPPSIVEAEGVVLLDGTPLKKVRVRLTPTSKFNREYSSFGVTDDNGKFTLTCNGKAGAAVGESVVIIEESEPPEHLRTSKGRPDEKERLELNKYYESLGGRPLPKQYTNAATSTLTVNVTPDKKSYQLYLTSQ